MLGVLQYSDFIAITVAVASVAMAFLDYFYIPTQLAATNKAVNIRDAYGDDRFDDAIDRKSGRTTQAEHQSAAGQRTIQL